MFVVDINRIEVIESVSDREKEDEEEEERCSSVFVLSSDESVDISRSVVVATSNVNRVGGDIVVGCIRGSMQQAMLAGNVSHPLAPWTTVRHCPLHSVSVPQYPLSCYNQKLLKFYLVFFFRKKKKKKNLT